MYVPNMAWAICILNYYLLLINPFVIQLCEIGISLDVLYFCLLNLALLPPQESRGVTLCWAVSQWQNWGLTLGSLASEPMSPITAVY